MEDGIKLRRGKKRGSPAAEEDRVDIDSLIRRLADSLNLPNQRIHIIGNQTLLPCVGIEVAVGAAVFAEGNVEVDGGVGHVWPIIRASGAGNKSDRRILRLFDFVCEKCNLSIDRLNRYCKLGGAISSDLGIFLINIIFDIPFFRMDEVNHI